MQGSISDPKNAFFFKTQLYMVKTGRSAKSCIKWFLFPKGEQLSKRWATQQISTLLHHGIHYGCLNDSTCIFYYLLRQNSKLSKLVYVNSVPLRNQRIMLTPGRHPEDPKMEQKVDYYTPAQSKQIVNIVKTFMSGICTCWISKLFWPETSLITNLFVAESSQKTVHFF